MIGTSEERLAELDVLYPVWDNDTLWSRFEKNAVLFSNQIFLEAEDIALTYRACMFETRKIAAALYSVGVRSDDKVLLRLKNCPEYVEISFALSMLGAVKIPVNPDSGDEEFFQILNIIKPDFFISANKDDPMLVENVMSGITGICFRGVDAPETNSTKSRILDWEQLVVAAETFGEDVYEYALQQKNPFKLSEIMFTSGSTANPKGVMITADMQLKTAYGTCRSRRMEIGRKIFVPIPLFHAFGFVEGLLAAMLVGGSVVFLKNRFSSLYAAEIMKKHKVNDIICVSLIMTKILSEVDIHPADYPALHAAYWANACPDWIWDRARIVFGIDDITTGYGLTECGSTATMLIPTDPRNYVHQCNGRLKQAGSAGGKYGTVLQIRIINPESGKPVSSGKCGEILLRGDTITRGYYNNHEATEVALDSDGWFHTKDVGILDENGYLKYLGRMDDMYKINGENVSPAYIDSIIKQLKIVNEAETVGIVSEKYGSVGASFIELKPGIETADAEDMLKEFCKEHLSSFQIPKYFIFLDSRRWPRTFNGKVRKKELGQLAIKILNLEADDREMQ